MPRLDSAATLPARAVPRPLAALFLLVLILAAAGAYLAAGVIRSDDGGGLLTKQGEPRGGFSIGDSVFTSFGAVAIESVEKKGGPTAKALSGVTHGVQNLIPPNKMQVQAFATMTNLTARTARYSPSMFTIVRGSKDAKPQGVFTASVKPGVLQPNAAIDMRLSFVVPRKGEKLWVRFQDPARAKPFFIDLGRSTKTPQNALSNYHLHRSGS
jgi:hypothetical protein